MPNVGFIQKLLDLEDKVAKKQPVKKNKKKWWNIRLNKQNINQFVSNWASLSVEFWIINSLNTFSLSLIKFWIIPSITTIIFKSELLKENFPSKINELKGYQSLQVRLQLLHLINLVMGSSDLLVCFWYSQKAVLSFLQKRHGSLPVIFLRLTV